MSLIVFKISSIVLFGALVAFLNFRMIMELHWPIAAIGCVVTMLTYSMGLIAIDKSSPGSGT